MPKTACPPELAPLLGTYTSTQTGGAFQASWNAKTGFTFSRLTPARLLLAQEQLPEFLRQLRFATFTKTGPGRP